MRRGNLFWGFVLILAGLIFLLSTTGALKGVDPWNLFWPLFLIVIGVWILFGNIFGRRYITSQQAVIPLEGAASAWVKISHGAGRLTLDSRAGPGELASGTFGGGLAYKTERTGSELAVKMRLPDQVFPFWGWGWSGGLDWSFGLNKDIPLKLDINTGAGEANFDLTDLRVTEFKLHTGATSTKLTVPANAGYTRGAVEMGAAALSIHIPNGVAARIRHRGGLSSISVDRSRFPRMGDAYQSADYETAANKVEIDIQAGVGSVDVR
jgi:hypothetical protein